MDRPPEQPDGGEPHDGGEPRHGGGQPDDVETPEGQEPPDAAPPPPPASPYGPPPTGDIVPPVPPAPPGPAFSEARPEPPGPAFSEAPPGPPAEVKRPGIGAGIGTGCGLQVLGVLLVFLGLGIVGSVWGFIWPFIVIPVLAGLLMISWRWRRFAAGILIVTAAMWLVVIGPCLGILTIGAV